MSSSPSKHKSSHHHHHHHHREHHSTSSASSGDLTMKTAMTIYPYMKTQDNAKLVPSYTAVLNRPKDVCLTLEELDLVQMEVEKLLSSVVMRYRSLKTGYDYLEDRKNQKKNADKLKASSASGKRKRDEKKSSKESSRQSQHTKNSKAKGTLSHSPAHLDHVDQSSSAEFPSHPNAGASHSQPNAKLLLPKNDVPNKFWLSVEPYCMPITQEDVRLLDNLIDDYLDPLVPPIPELGSHYVVRWTDLRDEHENSSGNAKSSKGSASNSTDAKDPSTKANEKTIDQGICGPLTQRLISALLEENSDIHSDTGGGESVQESNDSCTDPLSANQSSLIVSQFKSGIDVEKRLKKELLHLGILEASDFAKDKEDEVLNEIKRVRTELQAIAEYNRDELKLLRSAAKEEMKRLEVKRKLDRIDQEIIEAYRRVFAAKQKRRPLTKHERNEIYRLVNEQKRLSDQLEAMPIPGFNFAIGSADTSASSKTGTPSSTA